MEGGNLSVYKLYTLVGMLYNLLYIEYSPFSSQKCCFQSNITVNTKTNFQLCNSNLINKYDVCMYVHVRPKSKSKSKTPARRPPHFIYTPCIMYAPLLPLSRAKILICRRVLIISLIYPVGRVDGFIFYRFYCFLFLGVGGSAARNRKSKVEKEGFFLLAFVLRSSVPKRLSVCVSERLSV